MEIKNFLTFDNISSNNLNTLYSPETINSYYQANNITPDNEYMKTYLESETPKTTELSDYIKSIMSKNIPETIISDTPNYTSNSKTPQSSKDFVKMYSGAAKKASDEFGISEDMVLAQIALETGFGKHTPGYNLGGIKADSSWTGKSQVLATKEQGPNGLQNTSAKFRVYDSPEEGFKGYIEFLNKNKRYKKVFGIKDPYQAADAMASTGYATDKNYNLKLKSMINQIRKIKQNLS